MISANGRPGLGPRCFRREELWRSDFGSELEPGAAEPETEGARDDETECALDDAIEPEVDGARAVRVDPATEGARAVETDPAAEGARDGAREA